MSQENSSPKSFKAGAAVTRYRRVKLDANGDVVHAGADEVGIGIALETHALGEFTPVRIWAQTGTTKIEALAAVTKLAVVFAGAAGRVDDDPTIGPAIGIALEAASAAGDIIEIVPVVQTWGDQLLFAQVADSAAVTNTTVETDFSKKKTLNGALLRAGDVLEVVARVHFPATNLTDTALLKLYCATEIIAATPAVDVANGDIGYIHAWITVRTAGAAGVLDAAGELHLGTPGTANDRPFRVNAAAEDVSGNVDIKVSCTWSVANAGNQAILEDLIVILHRQ